MILYHGSKAANVDFLEPRSKLHGSNNEKVVYLSGNKAYALVYIWDSEKTNYSLKWITCALKAGVVHYEELFPDQLKVFYEGVSGYLYCVNHNKNMKRMPESHEDMYYSLEAVMVEDIIFVSDVYKELLRYEENGLLKVHRYLDATEGEKNDRVERIATFIKMHNFLVGDVEKARFVKYYCKQAWELAERWCDGNK